MAKIKNGHFHGEIRNRQEKQTTRGISEYDNTGNFIRSYKRHHKNVRRHYKH